ncbi:hypothetical protein SI65_03342 [Aspergillus cristatus]|uniref:Uncharacterized protein n=1 Tax=Aspergillus cristatus TaxID=573508 RepID=A0A1E3BH74_ASPCR|nr:hypothetical protein SI65_03342 [Aspergillus cristatus]
MAVKIEGACREVRRYLRAHGQNQRRHFTQYIHPQPLPQGWQLEWTQGGQTARVLQSRWEDQWRSRRMPWGELYPRPPRRSNLKLYQGLSKACCRLTVGWEFPYKEKKTVKVMVAGHRKPKQ